ncbi:MAG: magnesium transporter CorA family protein [Patescibacteria group bacterium]
MAIQELQGKHMRWINLTNVRQISDPEITYLKKNFHFHPLNLKDCLMNGQRPKIDVYDDYLFLVMLFPLYNRSTGEILSAEIDFFVSRDYLIMVHDNKLEPIVRLFNHMKKTGRDQERDTFLNRNVILVIHDLLNMLLQHCVPMLDNISLDIHQSEKKIFRGKEKEMVGAILAARRNIVNFRRIMQAHKNILKKLSHANRALSLYPAEKADIYFNNLIDRSKEIWDALDSFKESIEALYDTNESLISFNLNQIMKLFTSLSVVIFILTLVATVFAAKLPNTPLVHNTGGFWWLILIEIIVASAVIVVFKKRRWME